MGLLQFWRAWRAQQTIRSIKNAESDNLSIYADEYLKRTLQENADALKTAKKLNKSALLDMQTKKIKSEMQELLSNDDDDEEAYHDDDDDDDFGGKIFKDLASQYIKGKFSNNQMTPPLGTTSPTGAPSDLPPSIQELWGKLTPEQKQNIVRRFG